MHNVIYIKCGKLYDGLRDCLQENKQIIVKDGGHINSESGFNKFEEILDYIN